MPQLNQVAGMPVIATLPVSRLSRSCSPEIVCKAACRAWLGTTAAAPSLCRRQGESWGGVASALRLAAWCTDALLVKPLPSVARHYRCCSLPLPQARGELGRGRFWSVVCGPVYGCFAGNAPAERGSALRAGEGLRVVHVPAALSGLISVIQGCPESFLSRQGSAPKALAFFAVVPSGWSPMPPLPWRFPHPRLLSTWSSAVFG